MTALACVPRIVFIVTQFFLCAYEHKRKNWLFADTPKGADASAAVYTMVEMAKAHGLNMNIYKYLNYLLEHLPGTMMSDNALSKLAPWDQDVIACCSGAI